jgi:hypothetical protein
MASRPRIGAAADYDKEVLPTPSRKLRKTTARGAQAGIGQWSGNLRDLIPMEDFV